MSASTAAGVLTVENVLQAAEASVASGNAVDRPVLTAVEKAPRAVDAALSAPSLFAVPALVMSAARLSARPAIRPAAWAPRLYSLLRAEIFVCSSPSASWARATAWLWV